MYTSVALFALSGILAAGPAAESPTWLTSYSLARKQAESKHRPLAIFLGSGPSGWNNVSQSGKLGKRVQALLAEHYLCVYVDTSKPAGKELAGDFEIPDGLGIVISDANGQVQAFRHEGDLSTERLAQYLDRYSDPTRVVQFTETNPSERMSYYPSQSAPSYAPPYFIHSGGGRGC
jgi:hypothetical protein